MATKSPQISPWAYVEVYPSMARLKRYGLLETAKDEVILTSRCRRCRRRPTREGETVGKDRFFVSLASQAAGIGRPLSINVSSKATSAREWTLLCRANKDAVTARTLAWDQPVTGMHVWSYLLQYCRTDRTLRRYVEFTAYPTDEGGPA